MKGNRCKTSQNRKHSACVGLKRRISYFIPKTDDVIGSFKLGIAMHRELVLAVESITALNISPSRKCVCQSSGFMILILFIYTQSNFLDLIKSNTSSVVIEII